MLGDKPSWDRNEWFASLDTAAQHEFMLCRDWDARLALLDDGGRAYVSWLWDAFTELGYPDPKWLIEQEVVSNWPVLSGAHLLHGLWGSIETDGSSPDHDPDGQTLLAGGADPIVLRRFVRRSIIDVMSRFLYNLDAGVSHDLWDDRFPGWALMETDITGQLDRPTEDWPDEHETLTGRRLNVLDYFGPVTAEQIARDQADSSG